MNIAEGTIDLLCRESGSLYCRWSLSGSVSLRCHVCDYQGSWSLTFSGV